MPRLHLLVLINQLYINAVRIGAHPAARRRLAAAAALALALPLAAAAAFHAAVAWWPYPRASNAPPAPAAWIADRHGVPLAAFVSRDDQWHLPLRREDISPHLLYAVVAVEDARFREHAGVDWTAVAAAAWQNLSSRRVRRGASTITMQVQRLREPAPRTLWTKLREAVRACQLERRHTKDELLVEYVNRAPMGGNLVGAGAACLRYFGVPCRDLSPGQAALLAGLPQGPNRYRPDRHPDRARARRDRVLDRMLACAYITPGQHAAAREEPVDAFWRPLPQDRPGDALPPADGALPTLVELASRISRPGGARPNAGRSEFTLSDSEGLRRVTLDAAIQRQAALAAQETLARVDPSGAVAAAVVVLDTPTSECLAAVSLSRDAPDVDLTARPRSTGSALKPFLYAAAFEAGVCGPDSILRDAPAAWPGYVPENIDRDFRGAMTAAEALAESRNIPAMIVLARTGLDRAVEILGRAGFRTLARMPHRYGLSLAIGGAEATPREMAEAYATLARGGVHRNLTLLPQSAIHNPPSAISRDACWQTLSSLNAPGRTSPIAPEAARRDVAWKTGTSSGPRDAWCAAVSPRRTVVVWLGVPSGRGRHALVGGEAAAPLALHLLAALDPPGDGWPQASAPALPAGRPLISAAPSRLTIVSPAPGEDVLFDPDLPPDRQRVPLQARLSGSPGGAAAPPARRWWFVDGRPAGETPGDDRVWWAPVPGLHDVRVVDAAGRSAACRVRVGSN